MDATVEKLPAHETVYRQIHDKIMFGDLSPGETVTIQRLVDELGVSMTPVREAIRRLTAEGALEFQGNRRVSVPVMEPLKLDELAFARLAIEPKLAEIAAQKIDTEGIQTLAEADMAVNEAIASGDVQKYMRANHAFHFGLYSHAHSQILLPLAKTLWLRYGPLSRIISGRVGTGNLVDRHSETIDALKAGDQKATGQAIAMDIQQGFDLMRVAVDTV